MAASTITTTAALVGRRLAGVAAFSSVADARAAVGAGCGALIGTHDGSFHCDEALACGMLRYTTQFGSSVVVRSRVPAEHTECAIVVDVGATYVPETLRLDHHQPEFQGTMTTSRNEYKTRLSSAGLVYKHFGREVIRNVAADLCASGVLAAPPSDAHVELVYDVVYKNFVEHIDGIDNGVEQFSAATEGTGVKRNYVVATTLSSRVGNLNARWNDAPSKQRDNDRFVQAMALATTEFLDAVEYTLSAWLPARAIVETAFAAREQEDPSGRIVVLRQRFAPFKDHVDDIEREQGLEGHVYYVVFPDDRGGGRVQCMPKAESSFANRKSLPWRGLRDADLVAASGIEGCVFVHASGFIGGNKSMDGAIAMAKAALAAPAEEQ